VGGVAVGAEVGLGTNTVGLDDEGAAVVGLVGALDGRADGACVGVLLVQLPQCAGQLRAVYSLPRPDELHAAATTAEPLGSARSASKMGPHPTGSG
jgi:hypothetical protein